MPRMKTPAGIARSTEIWGGAAVIAGSAIPVFMVEDLYNEAGRVSDVRENYPWLSEAEVMHALRYAAEAPEAVAADRERHERAIRDALS